MTIINDHTEFTGTLTRVPHDGQLYFVFSAVGAIWVTLPNKRRVNDTLENVIIDKWTEKRELWKM